MSDTHSQDSFNSAKADEFVGKLVTTLNGGATCMMVSLGHRTGLFDTMRGMPPASSEEIARRAKLNERYVREWLGAVVAGGIVEFDSDKLQYFLPPEHAAFLTRAASPNNLAISARYVPMLGNVEDDLVECFKNGGGVPYERYPGFHALLAEDTANSVLSSLDEHILPLVPGIVERLEVGIRMLDAGCGSGRALNHLASRFPKSRFVGMDLSPEAIANARKEAKEKRNDNIEFVAVDMSNFHETAPVDEYDFVTTFDAIHDQARPLNVLRGIYRALKPTGIYLMQEVNGSVHVHKNAEHPLGPFLYMLSCMHCMTVSLAQGGDGLGALWGQEKTREYIQRAGFRSVETRQLNHDPVNNWYLIKK